MAGAAVSVLVCVTGQKSCERLIVAGAKIARRENQDLVVVHVARVGSNVLGYRSEPEALEYLLRTSIAHGADMRVRKSDDVVGALESEARAVNATTLVAGRAANYGGWDLLDELKGRLPDVRFEILSAR